VWAVQLKMCGVNLTLFISFVKEDNDEIKKCVANKGNIFIGYLP
jgi:hypothetical protein